MSNVFICTLEAIKVTTCPQNLDFSPPPLFVVGLLDGTDAGTAVEILSPFSLILASTFFNFTAFSGADHPPLPAIFSSFLGVGWLSLDPPLPSSTFLGYYRLGAGQL